METAKDFFKRNCSSYYDQSNEVRLVSGEECYKAMVLFAKMHCEAQAEAIKEKVFVNTTRDKYRNVIDSRVNQDSITEAYPLTNIK